MRVPETPVDEHARIATLHALDLLDTPNEERFDRLTRLARRLLGVETALVSLVDERRQWFKSAAGLDLDELPRETSFCGHAILDERILHVPDASLDPRFADNPLVTAAGGIRCYAGCPLHSRSGHKLGTLCVFDPAPRTFDDNELADLRDLAGIAERELQSHELATTDDLTGLPNRRGFLVMAEQALRMCRRSDVGVDLLYIDLDYFKEVNDTQGHAAGDEMLRRMAAALDSELRCSDPRGRLGGDEFAVLLPGDPDAFIERLHAALADAPIECSIGTVSFDPERHSSVDDLLQAADQRMYEQKHASRDAAGEPGTSGE